MFSSFLETAAAAVLCRLIGSYQDDDNRHIPLPRAWSFGIQKLPRHRPRRKNRKNPPIDWAFDHQRSVPPLFLTYNKSLSHILGFILTTQLEDRVTDELPVLYHPPTQILLRPRSTLHWFSWIFFFFSLEIQKSFDTWLFNSIVVFYKRRKITYAFFFLLFHFLRSVTQGPPA